MSAADDPPPKVTAAPPPRPRSRGRRIAGKRTLTAGLPPRATAAAGHGRELPAALQARLERSLGIELTRPGADELHRRGAVRRFPGSEEHHVADVIRWLARRAQRPFHTGRRLPRKAAMPSAASSSVSTLASSPSR